MNLIDKSLQLMEEQLSFIAVRIYKVENIPSLSVGTKMIVSKENFWGEILPLELQKEILKKAHHYLEKKVSRTENLNFEEGKIQVFWEFIARQKTILIIGAGHIAIPLCSLAKMQGFRVIVLDDRADCANKELFPEADEIIVGSFVEKVRELRFDSFTYVVLVTRGHTFDKDCLLEILGTEVAYIGMIGSLRRLAGVFRLLKEEGYQEDTLKKIHAPVGLPLGGGTPERIALSIIAEIISVYHWGPQWALDMKKDFQRLKKLPKK